MFTVFPAFKSTFKVQGFHGGTLDGEALAAAVVTDIETKRSRASVALAANSDVRHLQFYIISDLMTHERLKGGQCLPYFVLCVL